MCKKHLLLFFIAAAAFAVEPSRRIFPFPYTQEELPNGLRLITIPTEYPNIVALQIVVRTGSRNEVELGKSGFAHLFEHLMFRGTEKFPAEKYESMLKSAGAASNAYTSDDLTVYHTTFSKDDLPAILMIEADRFLHLKYSPAAFKTETLAVLGEYNKNSSNPLNKLVEVLQETAFTQHTYKHTTMGFLKDIQDMPNQYDYSLQFFDRYYRPEYTTIVVAGDVEPKRVRALVEQYWGDWKRGNYKADIPAEPPQWEPRTNHVDWPTPTLPWVAVAYHNAAYSDVEKDSATLDVLASVGFSPSSDLYRKLVIEEQKADILQAYNEDHVDPNLFTIVARVKQISNLDSVRDEILNAVGALVEHAVARERLEAVKNNLRYSFSLQMDNSEAIAGTLARYMSLRPTPETINRIYERYAEVTSADAQRIARKYLTEPNRTIVSLTGPGGKK